MLENQNLKLMSNKKKLLWYIGLFLLLYGLILLLLSFIPIIYNEIIYSISKPNENAQVIIDTVGIDDSAVTDKSVNTKNKFDKNTIIAADSNFSIVVPKIGANAPVIANVDPYKENIYQKELSKGVAHAEGSVFPGQIGTTFLFAHSSTNLHEAKRYNSIFYLLNKMDLNDEFYIVYGGNLYEYEVTDIYKVSPNNIQLIDENQISNVVKLMTCWPAGTNYKRLIIEGKLK